MYFTSSRESIGFGTIDLPVSLGIIDRSECLKDNSGHIIKVRNTWWTLDLLHIKR